MKNMKIYEVTLKTGAVRYYGFGEDCEIGDMVVAGTSHGPLFGEITNIPDELPDDLDADKIRYILCRVPNEGEAAEKCREIPIMECLSDIEQEVVKTHIAKIEQMMDDFMEQHKEEVMRLVFADYSKDFDEMVKEVKKLKSSLYHPEEGNLPDDTATAEKSETGEGECSGHCSDVPDSTGQCTL